MSDSPLIFIAYHGPDKQQAERLHTQLRAGGLRPWCDAVDLIPGDLWDEVIPARLRAARIILVLVSRTDHDGWYAKEEIAEGIDQARRDAGRAVIPVWLDDATKDDVPYGLKRVAQVHARSGDYAAVVDAVQRRLGAPVKSAPSPAPSAPAPTRPLIQLDPLVEATIRRRLDRDLLLSWLPDAVAARLASKPNYFDQITSDLTTLLKIGRLPDGQLALAIWLRQAERLAGPFAEARVYRDALRALGEDG